MALSKNDINPRGPDSSYFSKDNISFLGNLMAKFMYNEIGEAVTELQHLQSFSVESIGKSAYKLYLACELLQED